MSYKIFCLILGFFIFFALLNSVSIIVAAKTYQDQVLLYDTDADGMINNGDLNLLVTDLFSGQLNINTKPLNFPVIVSLLSDTLVSIDDFYNDTGIFIMSNSPYTEAKA